MKFWSLLVICILQASCTALKDELARRSFNSTKPGTASYLHMVYAVQDSASGGVVALRLNTSTGTLTQVGTMVSAGQYPEAITVAPSGDFVFVGNLGSNDVNSYRISKADGSLTALNTVSETYAQVKTMVFDPLGKFLFTGHRTDPGQITPYVLNTSSGALAEASSTASGTKTRGISVTPSGSYLYSGNWTASTVTAFSINRTTGVLTNIGSVATSGCPTGQRVDQAGSYLYVTDCWAGSFVRHAISSVDGTLGAAETTAVPGGASTNGLAISPNGKFLFATDYSNNLVVSFTIDPNTSAISYVGSVSTGTYAVGVEVDPDGEFVIVGAFDTGVRVYRINQTTGALTQTDNFILPETAPVISVIKFAQQ